MHDTVYHMTLNWNFICAFAVKHNFYAISKGYSVMEVTAYEST